MGDRDDQEGNAAWAARTAVSTSWGVASATMRRKMLDFVNVRTKI